MKAYGKTTGIVAALVALAVSGIALADHNPGHDKAKDKKKGLGSKISLDVENLCVPLNPEDIDVDFENATLKVTSTIKNESDSAILVSAVVTEKRVDGLQLLQPSNELKPSDEPKNKKYWDPVGPTDLSVVADPPIVEPETPINPGESRDYVSYINLCSESPLLENAIGLNAQVKVLLKNTDGDLLRSFVGNCDDVDLDKDGDRENDGDQSRIDFDDKEYYWLNDWLGC